MASIVADHDRPGPGRAAPSQIDRDPAWLKARANFQGYASRLERKAAKKGLILFAASAVTTALIILVTLSLLCPG